MWFAPVGELSTIAGPRRRYDPLSALESTSLEATRDLSLKQ
jgi:hypothetical protein